MLEQLTCPSCSAPLQHEMFKPGERIVDCPYCGNSMELPEDRKDKLRDVLDAVAESSLLGNLAEGAPAGAKMTTKINTTVSVVSLSEGDKSALKDQIRSMMGGLNAGQPGAATKVTITSQSGDVPPNVQEILSKMGIALAENATVHVKQPASIEPAEVDGRDDPSEPTESNQSAKKSLWKRLRRK